MTTKIAITKGRDTGEGCSPPAVDPRAPTHHTSPGRHSQLIGALMSSAGDDGVGSTMR